MPSYRVYEDELVLAFLDINPVGYGHTLVVPKQHFENVFDITEDLLSRVHSVAKSIAAAQRSALSAPGITITQNNGAAAGQIVFHLHVHVIPKDGEGGGRIQTNADELNKVASLLRQAVGRDA